ncbi:glycosyltransferase [Aurantiacibacter gangjinensis]|uniref:Dolichol monophosphate mannose synthase n=1 Tax=Aurantiacibacter gangjinensis TaxID=502682 RepID=A0A0G9MP95_9SPHN|nr:glycosyltransferase family 2 protein [Aurantiacibacter gangjinensis]APE28294.1 Dolichol-phosphate mannosyltransferase-like protein [Aurantiacibacter gangjinensis]KLE32535.1 dolichol monophosphate mannose synthase [Aurantiacibacter gangjinensis]
MDMVTGQLQQQINGAAALAKAAASRPLELAVVLPTLNERGNIAPMVERLEKALGPSGWEAVFVDDNSHDGTAEEARRIGQTDPRIRVIQRIGRRGLASAAIEGMCATAAPFVAVMDADHQHDPALLNDMLAAVKSGEYDLAYASRFAEGGNADGLSSKGREQGSRLANALARKLTGTELTDAMSGFFLLRTEQLRKQADGLSGIGFKIMLDILATARPQLKVKEFPLKFAERLSGESKLDHGVALDFVAGLAERYFGRWIPTRFVLFGFVGGLGVFVHMAVLAAIYWPDSIGFGWAQAIATVVAMSFNFWLNNLLTYRDQKLKGPDSMFWGWLKFCGACSIGAFANVAVATVLESEGLAWWAAALIGVAIASVWNYALSSKFVWGRFR